ncbi:MAG: eukaryotic-like serine/threonine-protein kinase [Thermoanaerobaculia bacterium]|jgi:serine/threonine-protein kinase|nr:eukaryotic-like serine/threonine-protein kinase [Thermoanaerobaculia bacterium]
MSNPKIIRQAAPSTPAVRRTTSTQRVLPDDLLREASRRLGIMSLTGAMLWILGTVLDHVAVQVMSHGYRRADQMEASDAIAGASVLISLALFFYSRRSERNPRAILDLGLVYLVLTSVALGMVMHWEPVPSHWPITPSISWIGAVVLMFAAIIPSTRNKTLIAGLIAVSMNPLGMLIARARGAWDFGATSNVLLMHYPDYLLVGVAVVISHVLTKLGREIVNAREMGSYRLGELIGSGGMGEVYKGTHRMLARPAAIKLIRPEMLREQDGESARVALQRFRREAEAAASLRSPHTVELYDFGVTEDQTMYFVMEMLDGMDLQSMVRRYGPMPQERVIFILRQVCESLEEAHVRGLVHRDIKPANIHVGRLGLQHDFVKVLDFGLVKATGDTVGEHWLGTDAGLTPGTPAYMSPEMAAGESLDGRADIYALGCVAYFLLTGHLVFEADTLFQMMAKLLRDDPVPPSQRTTLPIAPALDALIMACLARKRDDRPATAAELRSHLAAIEIPEWDEDQAKEWWDRLPVESASAVAIIDDATTMMQATESEAV